MQKTACEIMNSGIPLAILPLGTANNLARNLGFVASVEDVFQSLQCGKSGPSDIGMARSASQSRYFFEAARGRLFANYSPVAEARKKMGLLRRNNSLRTSRFCAIWRSITRRATGK